MPAPRPSSHPVAAPETVRRASELVAGADRIVVLTGAGISTDSGIPDFRGPDGVWTRNPEMERLSTIDTYLGSAEVRERAWRARMDHPAWRADPNPGHEAIAELSRTGRLTLTVTQNIDGLHVEAGLPHEDVVEVHGTMRQVRCVGCGITSPMQTTLDRVRAGEADPPCELCGGILKSATIFFGEALVADDLNRAFAAAADADLLLAVGSTLQVYPVADMVPIAASAGASIVIVNGEPTAMDDLADVVVLGSISEVLPAILRP
ncbi:MAG: Sir2 family NAD-dependent protein deacetylase [Microthrixaceae bacterium]